MTNYAKSQFGPSAESVTITPIEFNSSRIWSAFAQSLFALASDRLTSSSSTLGAISARRGSSSGSISANSLVGSIPKTAPADSSNQSTA